MLGECQFVDNQKKCKNAFFEGYEFIKHKTCKEKIHWRCSQYVKSRCPGRITTVESNVVAKSEHSHAADARCKEKRLVLSEIRQNAVDSSSPPRRVIRSATAKISTIAATELPKYETLTRNIRRIRQKANVTPQLPQTKSALKIDGEFAIMVKQEPFVLFDNKDAENRIVIFATRDNLNFMVLCDDLYMDGTFDIAPPLFKQVYTIYGRKNNRHFPLVCVLACKKDFYTYETVLRQLKLAEPRLKPKAVMVDFEMVAIKAAHEVFPDADVHGCYFHYCLYRQIQANGLQTIYQENSTFAMYMRCLAALAFFPVDDVLKRFNELKTSEFFKEKLAGTTSIDIGVQKLFEYMETNWIGTKPRRTYKPGKFAIDLWNVYELTLECFPRTNNC